jgi:hypothetical protein
MQIHKSISSLIPISNIEFSICTIVNKMDEYQLMKQSFETCGFADNCEYLIADNTPGNQYDAYQAINIFLQQASAQYIILTHQDVRCIDPITILQKSLQSLTEIDPAWALCGNAGGNGYHNIYYHLTNNGNIRKTSNLPLRVTSLDENFIVIKKTSNLAVSSSVKGFHLYGTDLCLVANFLGYTAYVIPFMVDHLSLGNLSDLKKHTIDYITAYNNKYKSRFIQTPATKFYLGNNAFENKLYNAPAVFVFVKWIQRIKNIFR